MEQEVDPQNERSVRAAHVVELRAQGIDPYPVKFDRDRTLSELRSDFGDLEPGTETEVSVSIAGRLMLIRRQGKLVFATMRDRDGAVQLFVSANSISDEGFERFQQLNLGDWVGATGTVMTTKKGELSVKVSDFVLLAKAVRPLPDKWHGLTDVDTRFRQRYVDLAVNDDARRVFEIRFAAIDAIRSELRKRNYLEVEGPMLHTEPGGATALPFVTEYNALGMNVYMRIALELHLKRLIVGGLDRVFEIGRVFRNEGLDTRHNPEFTMLESYEAFADYFDMMTLTESLVTAAAMSALGTTKINIGETEVDLAGPWNRVSMIDLLAEHLDVKMHPSMPVPDARKLAQKFGVEIEERYGSGRILATIYDELIEKKLVQPTIVMDYPVEISPLARLHRDDPMLTERFEAIVGGRELANAFSELNDPAEQRKRFEHEAASRAAGDDEAGFVDEDYIRALEYGLPPTGGMGMGIDRLTMLLAGVTSIREVILFPTLRPEA